METGEIWDEDAPGFLDWFHKTDRWKKANGFAVIRHELICKCEKKRKRGKHKFKKPRGAY